MTHDSIIEGHILNIIQNHEVKEQADLQEMLKKRGYDIPQATLSRKLKKMKIAKVSGIYKIVDLNVPSLPLVLNMQVSDFGMIILQTNPGNASSLAYFIDRKYVNFSPNEGKNSGILGTIAGDDTVLVMVKGKDDIAKVVKLLQGDFPYLGVS